MALRALVATLALHAGVAAAQTPIFLLDTDEASFASLFRVEPTSGQLIAIGALPAELGPIVALAAASDDLLYAVAQSGEVLEISVEPFGITSLGNVGPNVVVGLAFADAGLYAVQEGTNALYRIELAPLSMAMIGPVTLPDGTPLGILGGDLAQDSAGRWFLWTNSAQALFALDVTTAMATPVPAQQTGLGFTTGLAFDYQRGDALLASVGEQDALRTLDPASGQAVAAVAFCLDCPTPYDAAFGDMASAAPTLPCPMPKGFWRTNVAAWPVRTLVLGGQSYGPIGLFILLVLPARGDASLILASQLIAAKLNVAAGSDPLPVEAPIASADAQLAAFPGFLPYRVTRPSPTRQAMLETSGLLATYNQGSLTPSCVP